MKFLLSAFFFCFTVVVFVYADCHYGDTRMKVGEVISGDHGKGCVEVTCYEMGMVTLKCPPVSIPGGCEFIPHSDQPYPQCCGEVKCSKDTAK